MWQKATERRELQGKGGQICELLILGHWGSIGTQSLLVKGNNFLPLIFLESKVGGSIKIEEIHRMEQKNRCSTKERWDSGSRRLVSPWQLGF